MYSRTIFLLSAGTMVCVLQCISLHVAQIDHFLYNRVIDDRVPPLRGLPTCYIYMSLAKKNY